MKLSDLAIFGVGMVAVTILWRFTPDSPPTVTTPSHHYADLPPASAFDADKCPMYLPDLGTPAQMIRESCWGKPYDRVKSVDASGKHEVWRYRTGFIMYFHDDVLIALDDLR